MNVAHRPSSRPIAAFSIRRPGGGGGSSTTRAAENPQAFNLSNMSADLPSASGAPSSPAPAPSSSRPGSPRASAAPASQAQGAGQQADIPEVAESLGQMTIDDAAAGPSSQTQGEQSQPQYDGSQIVEGLEQMTMEDGAAPNHWAQLPAQTFSFDQIDAPPAPVNPLTRQYDYDWVRTMLSNLLVESMYANPADFSQWVGPLVYNSEFLTESDTWVRTSWPTVGHDYREPISYDQMFQLMKDWLEQVLRRAVVARVRVASLQGRSREAAGYVGDDITDGLLPYAVRIPGLREQDINYDESGNLVKKNKKN